MGKCKHRHREGQAHVYNLKEIFQDITGEFNQRVKGLFSTKELEEFAKDLISFIGKDDSPAEACSNFYQDVIETILGELDYSTELFNDSICCKIEKGLKQSDIASLAESVRELEIATLDALHHRKELIYTFLFMTWINGVSEL